MSSVSALQLVLLAGLGFALAAGLVVSAAAPAALARVAPWDPERRHRALLLLALSPPALGGVGLLAALLPSLLAVGWPAHDHCLAHHGHVHLCFLHPPTQVASPTSWLLLALAAAWLATRSVVALAGLARANRLARRLLDFQRIDARLGARVLPTATPLCLLVGLVRPKVVLSEGLLSQVSSEDLDVMLHHERAHAVRRDTPVRLLATAATAFVWRPVRTRLLRELSLAAEQSCDEAAGRAVGDRLRVAEVLLRVERLLQTPADGLARVTASFGGDLSARVESLLEEPRPPGTLMRPLALVVLAALALLTASDPLHHATESLLGALTH
ncbi:MAG: M56 family peptidase [Myxococcaceae bacterium]|nr:MAG: M56 family peptidase [Myxococcaceae bacterium]